MLEVILPLFVRDIAAHPAVEQAGHHGVDPDVVAGQFAGQRQGEAHDSALGGGIMHRHFEHAHAGQRAEVDDRACLAADHAANECLGDQEHAFDVHVHHPVPVLLLDQRERHDLGDPGVVDQDVHRAEVLLDLLRHFHATRLSSTSRG